MIIKPLKKNTDFVAFVNGIDLSKGLSKKNAIKIDGLINKFAVLIFRNQPLTDDQQINFTEYFGPNPFSKKN